MEAPESLIGKGIECPTCHIKSIVELPKDQTPAEDARADRVRKVYQYKIWCQQMKLSPEARRQRIKVTYVVSMIFGVALFFLGLLVVMVSMDSSTLKYPFGGYTMLIMGTILIGVGQVVYAIGCLIPNYHPEHKTIPQSQETIQQ